jgi:hypothetical protein
VDTLSTRTGEDTHRPGRVGDGLVAAPALLGAAIAATTRTLRV